MSSGGAVKGTVASTGTAEGVGAGRMAMGLLTSRTLHLFKDVLDAWGSGPHGGRDALLSVPPDKAVAVFVKKHGFKGQSERAWVRLYVLAYRRAATLGMALETVMREADRSVERRRELLELGALLRDAELSMQDTHAALFGYKPGRHRNPPDPKACANHSRRTTESLATCSHPEEV